MVSFISQFAEINWLCDILGRQGTIYTIGLVGGEVYQKIKS